MKIYNNGINENTNIEIKVKLVYSNKIMIDQGWVPSLHQHPHTEIFYVLSGKGKLILIDDEIDINANDFLIINSNLKHTEMNAYIKNNSQNLEYLVVGVEGISIKEISDKNDKSSINDFVQTYIFKKSFEDNNNKIYDLIKSIHQEMLEKNKYSGIYANKLLELLIISILRLQDENIEIEDDFKENKQIEFIKKYIDSHFSMEFNLDDLSKIGYVNKYYLIHQFKKLYGITPIEYMIEKRITSAKDLLKNSNYSMQDISSIVGFNSQAYFNQVFKKKVGITPGKYRSSDAVTE